MLSSASARQRSTPARSVPRAIPVGCRAPAQLIAGLPLFDRAAGLFPRPDRGAAAVAQTPSKPAVAQDCPLARTPKGRAFTLACLVRLGDLAPQDTQFQTGGFQASSQPNRAILPNFLSKFSEIFQQVFDPNEFSLPE